MQENRNVKSIVAIELKIDDFKPEYLGKMEFYLEALDRDVKKPQENPSVESFESERYSKAKEASRKRLLKKFWN